jgi:hypothetical protein
VTFGVAGAPAKDGGGESGSSCCDCVLLKVLPLTFARRMVPDLRPPPTQDDIQAFFPAAASESGGLGNRLLTPSSSGVRRSAEAVDEAEEE